tara:strand:- start:713 stop:886 length:174 start_codon:yes stop_codon:yes gene_type:complete
MDWLIPCPVTIRKPRVSQAYEMRFATSDAPFSSSKERLRSITGTPSDVSPIPKAALP